MIPRKIVILPVKHYFVFLLSTHSAYDFRFLLLSEGLKERLYSLDFRRVSHNRFIFVIFNSRNEWSVPVLYIEIWGQFRDVQLLSRLPVDRIDLLALFVDRTDLRQERVRDQVAVARFVRIVIVVLQSIYW